MNFNDIRVWTAFSCALLLAAYCVRAEGVSTALPLTGTWSFRLDGQDVGVAEEWFTQEFDDYGHKTLAADIADKTVSNTIKHGINERYDSLSGKGIGVEDYCMSCTLATMMLDGLTREYEARLHDDPHRR